MAKPKIYIDGQEGTTGLRIFERFAGRDDIEILTIDPALRKDLDERRKLINASDITFLCLPDAAAKEAVSLVDNDNVRIIDRAPREPRLGLRLPGAQRRASRGDRQRQAHCQPRLPRDGLCFARSSADCQRRAPGG